ncbi:hypothetical protein F4819DRAFT_15139 [Hypoxylon fuscum]|nr:hypothetical protein F4819DRAFT_15139 [Hypoxylon fuscum]
MVRFLLVSLLLLYSLRCDPYHSYYLVGTLCIVIYSATIRSLALLRAIRSEFPQNATHSLWLDALILATQLKAAGTLLAGPGVYRF